MVERLAEVQQRQHRRHVRVGAVIRRPRYAAPPRLEDARQVFVGNGDGRVGFVVFKQDVIPRLVALDKVVLQEQRILLRLDHDVADVANARDEQLRLARLLVARKIR